MQRGGERTAREVLSSFLDDRGLGYRGGISSPMTAEHGLLAAEPISGVG
jgi:hypothetical protein